MKIAQVVCVFPPYRGGIGNSAFHFSRLLTSAGHDVTVFTPNYNNETGEEKIENFTVVRLSPWLKIGNAAFIPQLFCYLADFDIVHFHYPFFGACKAILLNKILRRKTKLVVHYHMDTTAAGPKGVIFSLYRYFVLPLVISFADAITCASLDYIDDSFIKSNFTKQPDKFHEIGFGVDLEKFKSRQRDRRQSEKNILFVAGLDRAHYFKGLETLLEAVKLIVGDKRINLNFKMQIVGDGELRPNYEKKVKDLGLENQVEFIGQVSERELINYYQLADVFVLPSINQGEAFGLVLLEAMACGAPVIASNLPGVRDVFKNGEQGFYFMPGNADELSKRILTILTGNVTADNFSRSARELAEQKYSWDKVRENLNKVYEDLFNK